MTESHKVPAAEAQAAQVKLRRRVRAIAQRFVDRATELGMKGKRRDAAALEYFVGAAALAEAIGDNLLHQYLGRVTAFIIAIHGYAGVQRLLED